jgi:uracil-DNA glycosylase
LGVADALLEALAGRAETADVANPYAGAAAGAWRRRNLARYLEAVTAGGEDAPGVALIGEAPGYRGCAVTGVPFTSRQVLSGSAGRWGLFAPAGYAAGEALGRPWAEATATLVWRHLPGALGALARPPLLWNAYPFHPRPRGRPAGNRGLTAAEMAEGATYLELALRLCPGVRPVAVGRAAALALARLGVTPLAVLRHPAHGGAAAFAAGLTAVAGALRESGAGESAGEGAGDGERDARAG